MPKPVFQCAHALVVLSLLGLVGCYSTLEVGDGPTGEAESGVIVKQTKKDLPQCNRGHDGIVYYVSDSGKFFYCDGDKRKYIRLHLVGQDGSSCTVTQDNGSATISCEDGTDATVSDGQDGADGAPGADGQDGTSCTVIDNLDGTKTISCTDGTSVTVSDGAQGPPGADGAPGADGQDGTSCTVVDNLDGTKTISCTDGTSVTVSDGQDGADGTSCTVVDNLDGTYDITCGDNTVTVTDDSCTVVTNGCIATVSCDDGTFATVPLADTACGVDGVCEAGACRERSWGTPELIETNDAGSAGAPQVAVDPNGDATAVWQQSDGIMTNIWSNRYTPSGGWGTAELIETNDAGSAGAPQVAVNPNGDATAVWQQSDGVRVNIWANRYTPSGGWGVAELIETDDTGDAQAPQVAVDPDGNATAVWNQSDGTVTNIWANRYTPGGGWGAAEPIETNDVGFPLAPQVGMDDNGNAVAVWTRKVFVLAGSVRQRRDIWANRYTPGGGWGTAELIDTIDATSPNTVVLSGEAALAVDPNGNAIAVWVEPDGVASNHSVWSNRYTPAGGWGVAELAENNDTEARIPDVAMDPNGDAVAVWQTGRFASSFKTIWANRYTAGEGWGVDERIEAHDFGGGVGGIQPQVAVDFNGNATAVWTYVDRTPVLKVTVWSNRYTPGGGWGTPVPIETEDVGLGPNPQVAVDPDGNATAVWQQSDGILTNIWSNRYE